MQAILQQNKHRVPSLRLIEISRHWKLMKIAMSRFCVLQKF